MLEGRSKGVIQCGREISGKELAEIEETVGLFPKLSRSELAETLCENLGWVTASGGYKRDVCLKLLKRLEGEGVVKLPEKKKRERKPEAGKGRDKDAEKRKERSGSGVAGKGERRRVGCPCPCDPAQSQEWISKC